MCIRDSLYINVMNRLSVDCDCDGNPAEPDMHDIGILASYDLSLIHIYTGSLDNRMRELVTVTVLTAISALPQLKAHAQASLNVGCTPVEIREAVYQCAPFIGFPRTLNAISTMNEVFSANDIALPLPEQKKLASDEERYAKGFEIQAPVYGTEIAERYTWLPRCV